MNWTDWETITVRGRDFAVMAERDDAMGEPWVEHDGHGMPQGDDVAAVTFSHSYLDRCTPISEARARQLDPALVAYMEQPE